MKLTYDTCVMLLNSRLQQGLRKIVFNELRTKEQLGYAVYASMQVNPDGTFGIALLVGRHTDKHW